MSGRLRSSLFFYYIMKFLALKIQNIIVDKLCRLKKE